MSVSLTLPCAPHHPGFSLPFCPPFLFGVVCLVVCVVGVFFVVVVCGCWVFLLFFSDLLVKSRELCFVKLHVL